MKYFIQNLTVFCCSLLLLILVVNCSDSHKANSDTSFSSELVELAKLGNAEAQYKLGRCYYNGEGVTPNYTEAAKWIQKAADQGFAQAQYNMGDLYLAGLGVCKDWSKAKKWYTKAAEQGHKGAIITLETLK
ncbi:MAG: sel1 repeat family protein [Prevotellaceae bacterium]|nr:sel1 repeat family protein [Prevotellaceae bacterium]